MTTKNRTTEPLIIERTFNAPVAQVWKAISNRDDMKHWYFDLTEFRPEVGFQFAFVVEHEGTKYDHRCRVTEVIPNRKLAYTWRYEGHPGDSLVTWELFPEGSGTRLKLTHERLETFPALPAYARKNFETGWTEILGTSLKNFVEGAPAKPSVGDTPDREIVTTREFNAPRERVWEAITNPLHVAKWWGPRGFSTTIETMDVRPDGVWKFVMHGPGGADYHNRSIFTEVVKPERIVYQHLEPIHRFQMTMVLATQAGRTLLTWRMLFESVEECAKLKDFISDANEQNFDRLQEHLATMA